MQYWDSKGRIHDTEAKQAPLIDSISNQAKAVLTNAHTWLENSNPNSEDYKQKIGVALGLMTAPIGGSMALTNNIAKTLAPVVGKKIAQTMGAGASSGLVGGGVEGVARGALTGKNPLLTGLSDSAFGAIAGLTGGLVGGKIGQNIARKSLQNNPTAQKQYFDDYIADLSNKSKAMADYRGLSQGARGLGKPITKHNFIGENLYIINKEAKKYRDMQNGLYDLYADNYTTPERAKLLEEQLRNFDPKGYKNIRIDEDGVYYDGDVPLRDIEDLKQMAKEIEFEDEDIAEEYLEAADTLEDAKNKLQEWGKFKTFSKKKNKLYEIKEDILNKLNKTPIDYHEFKNGDIRPLYQIDGFTFHGAPIEELYIKPSKKLNEISSENKLEKTLNINSAIDNINKKLGTNYNFDPKQYLSIFPSLSLYELLKQQENAQENNVTY